MHCFKSYLYIMSTKVIVGMSGGVDSSVAAWLLQEEGYEVEGLFMKNWEQDDADGYCAAAQDLADAQIVADKLRIPLHTVNFAQEYWQKVFTHFLNEYAAGRTPNPDVLCNKEIKFKAFLQHALNLGADFIATGHYAKIQQQESGPALLKAKDRNKDQTYFLHAIEPIALNKTLFPVGNYLKSEIRSFAQKLQLITHDKKDSTGICFIGEKKFKTFLNEFLLAKPGEIQGVDGKNLGKHDGLMFYTLGQRQGLGIGGKQDAQEEPWYVVDKDIKNNLLIVAQGNHSLLYSKGLLCSPIHWLAPHYQEQLPLTCFAKMRYRQEDQACIVSPLNGNQHCVMFSNPQRAITPGQYLVLYDKNRCLGGAIIEQIIR
jgi:tRNA-specific 2-thiouridylase